jgi:hypothetical protein
MRQAILATVMVVVCAPAFAWEDAPLIGPFDKAEYPRALIDRPLTLPAGMVEGDVGFAFASRRFDEPFLRSTSLEVAGYDEWTADITLRAGLTDRVQLEVGTAFSLDYEQRGAGNFQGTRPFDLRPSLTSWNRVVPVRLSFLALDTETVDTAVAVTVPFVGYSERRLSFGRGGSVRLRNSDGRVVPAVGLEAPTRWRLTDWLWLRAGENLFAVTTGAGVAQFTFNLGLGVQPHEIFAVTLDTRVASIAFDGSGDEGSETLADRGVIDLEGTLSPCRWFDLVGSLGMPDVGGGFDNYVTRVGVRVRF